MTDPIGSDGKQEQVGAERDSEPNGRITFRTVWGGPSPQAGYIEELERIKRGLRTVGFSYHFDLFLMVGGDITPAPGPSGLRTPRVFLSRRTVTGEIRISKDDVRVAADPIAFLRQTIHTALIDLMTRIATRDPAFDADEELRKVAFLIEEAATPDTPADPEAMTTATPRAGK